MEQDQQQPLFKRKKAKTAIKRTRESFEDAEAEEDRHHSATDVRALIEMRRLAAHNASITQEHGNEDSFADKWQSADKPATTAKSSIISASDNTNGNNFGNLVKGESISADRGESFLSTSAIEKHVDKYIRSELEKLRSSTSFNKSDTQQVDDSNVEKSSKFMYDESDVIKSLPASLTQTRSNELKEGQIDIKAGMLLSAPEIDVGLQSIFQLVQEIETDRMEEYRRNPDSNNGSARPANIADSEWFTPLFLPS